MSDPAEIYLQPECCADPYSAQGRLWCEHDAPVDCEDGVPWTKYVIAARVRELEEELRIGRQASEIVGRMATQQLERVRELEAERDSLRCPNCDHLRLELGALRRENDALRAQRDQAIARIKDMLMGDDGQAWKEARKFLDIIDAALAQGEKP